MSRSNRSRRQRRHQRNGRRGEDLLVLADREPRERGHDRGFRLRGGTVLRLRVEADARGGGWALIETGLAGCPSRESWVLRAAAGAVPPDCGA